MTSQEIRIALAEWDGWKWNGPEGESFKYLTYWTPPGAKGQLNDKSIDHLPDYPSDLNAVNELEKKLKDDNSTSGLVAYCNTLMQIVGSHRACVFATASQRCEALLRTLNKWKE